MKEQFKPIKFRKDTLLIVEQANEIIKEYQADGYDLTLRQLYYQFVARDILKNSQESYNKLGDIISNARLNGDVDWDAIKDRTRNLGSNLHWASPAERMRYSARNYLIDTRCDQMTYIEVWVEKEALVGVVKRACKGLDLPWFACRGYVSQTAMYEASERFRERQDMGQSSVILHLGDHDPSGIDMSRDISDRLNIIFGGEVNVERIALNMEQVREYNPPPNPAKMTDSRCGDYVKKYGKLSWELDALPPNVLAELIRSEVALYTDIEKMEALQEIQANERELLLKCSQNWDKIEKLFGGDDV